MGKQMNGGSGRIREDKRWPLIHGPLFLTVLLVISMIQVSVQGRMSTIDQPLNKIRSLRYAKQKVNSGTQSSRVCSTVECTEVANQIKSSMNISVDPCDDFYEYACGNWLISNPLPNGTSTYSVIDKLARMRKSYFINILENETITINGANRNLVKVPINFYKSCKNQTAIESLGDFPLKELIRDLGGWSMVEEDGIWDENNWDFERIFGSIHKNYNSMEGPLFSVYVEYDKASDGNTIFSIHVDPLRIEKEQVNRTAAHKQYITDVVTLLGGRINITNKVQALVDFEAKIEESLPGPDESIPKNKMTLKKLQQEVSQFNWTNHFNHMLPVSVPETELIYVPALPYLKKAIELVQNSSKSVLANYLVWNVIKKEIAYLSTPYRQAHLSFINITASNVSTEERSQNCALEAETSFIELMAAAYITDHGGQFGSLKNMVKQMTNEIKKGFKENINSLTWFDAATKTKINEKVDAIEDKIGFPDYLSTPAKVAQKFQKYNTLILKKDKYFKNRIAISKWKQKQMLKKYGHPVNDDDMWPVYAQEGNDGAVNVADNNWLIQPLATLIPPYFYRSQFLRALNFGSLGSNIGFEIMRGFDKDARQFDKNGRRIIGQMWSDRTLREIHTRERCFARQYSQYRLFGTLQVEGNRFSSYYAMEDGGLKAASKAYYNWAKKKASKTWTLLNLNLTNEQLFFVMFGQRHCRGGTRAGLTEAFVENRFWDKKYWVIGALSNSCDFANAFKCKTNSPMNPGQKCSLWSKDGPFV